jgi:hypothetical protein
MTRLKPLIEQEKQQDTNNLCLYCGKPSHVVCECPKKQGPHIENQKMRMSNLNRDLETRLQYIMCWEWS